jgi:peroxiredoxin Q/BCP
MGDCHITRTRSHKEKSMRACLLYRRLLACVAAMAMAFSAATANQLTAQEVTGVPAVGDVATDFTLSSVDGEAVQLSALLKRGPVVLLVLRGYPGYQCPICNTQVGQFLGSSAKLKAAGANVVMVYPGPADGLKQHAGEFIRGKTLPENFYFTLDPDYDFTNKYHLRWEKKNETAYPSTFVINPSGKIEFAKISMTHGGRASAEEVLKALSSK